MYNMKTKNKHLTISEKNGNVLLIYTYKIIQKEVIRKNRGKTVNKFYSGFMPPELVEYLKLTDNQLYFYQKGKDILITSNKPHEGHKGIQIQKTNEIRIPRKFFNPAEFDYVRLTLDFSRVDDYKSGLGVLKMELV